MDLEDLRAFVIVADLGSLSAAGRHLGVSVATAGRRIDALERAVGVPLLRRGSGGVSLSDAGRRLLDSARLAIDRVSDIERVGAALRSGVAEPAVRISAVEAIVSQVLAPALPILFEAGPVALEFSTAAAVADFDRHECDIAVRMFRPTGDALVARRLPDITLGLFASEEYFDGADPAGMSLIGARLLMMSGAFGRIPEVEWVERHGLERAVVVTSSSSQSLLQAARSGVGVAMLPDFLAAGLVRIPAPPIPPRQCWLVSHPDTRRSPRHRRVADWVAGTLRSALDNHR